ncbi:unnamed protein product [Callosobruchus maculatus]|uniref:chitinase n=1 Tax=Callosobruchus maculatus TaxID=64391 RepID=A0A653DH40_CALMS|nr:unnamed protein product [Callosobruchus maculatus]
MMHTILIGLLISCLVSSALSDSGRVVCYYGSWSTYRNAIGKFTVTDIKPNLCTHAIYCFIGLNEDGTVKVMDPYLDIDLGYMKKFNDMKKQNPSLKTMVAIGGWNEGSLKYSAMAASPARRQTFVQSAVKFLQSHGFDGLDLDWEYPGRRGGASYDKANFVSLIKELKSAFAEHGLLLSAAVSAAASAVDISYDVRALSQHLDMINLMSYDLHGSWDKVTGQNAPLYPSQFDTTPASKELNIQSCVEAWISRGASRSKLNLGLAFYGRSFTLNNPNNNGLGAPISGPGLPGRYSGESGMLTYYEIIEHLKTKQWTYKWDQEQEVPYIHKANQWIGFDDTRSIAKKVEYAKSEQLGGVMVWSLESDDFRGLSGTNYPLLRTANLMKDDSDKPFTVPTPNTTSDAPVPSTGAASSTSVPSTTSASSTTSGSTSIPSGLCPGKGFFRDPEDCQVFYHCPKAGVPLSEYKFVCAEKLLFDNSIESCNWAELVKDC